MAVILATINLEILPLMAGLLESHWSCVSETDMRNSKTIFISTDTPPRFLIDLKLQSLHVYTLTMVSDYKSIVSRDNAESTTTGNIGQNPVFD